ncbi:hypothetical protein A0H81_10512 [Grifola frondosa]|uniref:Uncharacterized protein n=1 Tax=Grifola frondosa TaxID=5627 RepID=A0A1C7LZG9_GRIFR|nr:hypothetical protein A0H81_10512 [Grifola frondosa]
MAHWQPDQTTDPQAPYPRSVAILIPRVVIFVIALIEPFSNQVVLPLIPDLIRSTGIDESKVGYHAGIMQFVFHAMEASVYFYWMHSSRQPIVAVSLLGFSLSMYAFGLLQNFWSLLMVRGVHGFMSAYTKLTLEELMWSTAFVDMGPILPTAWSISLLLGRSSVTVRYALERPRLSGNIRLSVFSLLIRSTQNESVSSTLFNSCNVVGTGLHIINVLQDFNPPPTVRRQRASMANRFASKRLAALVPHITCLTLVDIMLRTVQPVFYSTPIHFGGLGLAPFSIGIIICIHNLINLTLQNYAFEKIYSAYGPRRIFMSALVFALPVAILFPFINSLAAGFEGQGLGIMTWFAITLQNIMLVVVNFAYGALLSRSSHKMVVLASLQDVYTFACRHAPLTTTTKHTSNLFLR